MSNFFNFSFPDTKKYKAWTDEMKTIRREFTRPAQQMYMIYTALKAVDGIIHIITKIKNKRNENSTENQKSKPKKAS